MTVIPCVSVQEEVPQNHSNLQFYSRTRRCTSVMVSTSAAVPHSLRYAGLESRQVRSECRKILDTTELKLEECPMHDSIPIIKRTLWCVCVCVSAVIRASSGFNCTIYENTSCSVYVCEGGLWQPSRWVPIVAGMVLSAACKMQCLSTYMKLLLCACRVSN